MGVFKKMLDDDPEVMEEVLEMNRLEHKIAKHIRDVTPGMKSVEKSKYGVMGFPSSLEGCDELRAQLVDNLKRVGLQLADPNKTDAEGNRLDDRAYSIWRFSATGYKTSLERQLIALKLHRKGLEANREKGVNRERFEFIKELHILARIYEESLMCDEPLEQHGDMIIKCVMDYCLRDKR